VSDIVIDVRSVTRTYHSGDVDVEALRKVSLTIARGEFVAIVGSSGSGKSTLMAILGCLDRPTSGQYLFEGVDVAQLSEPDLARIRSARIGFVFQTFNLLARTSAIENVALPLFYSTNGPTRRAERVTRARAALEFLGLSSRERNTPAQLSGGQQQRVAIARALINHPALLLADEPTGNVDTRTSHEIMQQLVTLNHYQNVTVIVVTHEPDIAAYADRVITIRDGEIVGDERKTIRESSPTDAACVQVSPRNESVAVGSSVLFGLMALGAAVQALRRNLLRSALTMLGVFIGVAALIAMVAVGQGANEAVKKQIESLGTNLLVVMPGAATMTGARGGSGSASTLTVSDATAILRESLTVARVSYLTRQMGQVQYGNQNWTTQIQGVEPNYPPITSWEMAVGRDFTGDDDRDAAQVVVLGQTVYRQLFGLSENPVGATILVKRVPMRVIGVFASKGQTPMGQDQDDLIMIPFTTAERKVLGVAAPTQQTSQTNIYTVAANPFGLQPRLTGYVNSIFVQATTPEDVSKTIDQITGTLARRHHIKSGDPNDFSVRNLSQIAEVVQGSSRIMALLLATVASISLIVGGIGIMNILLVSVTERTREIGLRMAIGARRLHVLLQFLAEAVFLSLTGGVIGIVGGLLASKIISAVAGWPTAVPPAAIAGGFLFSAAVGIFFGYYPARKASRLDPIEALHYE
jgi:macrolide transport system ATP-binding/permease protein